MTWMSTLPIKPLPFSSRKEISKILRSSYLRGMNLASFFTASKIIVFVTFTTYVLLGNVITASRVFVAVTLYGAVRLTVTLFFPSAIEKVSEAVVSIRRIKNFLLLDEISQCNPPLLSDGKTIVHVQDFTAFWEKVKNFPFPGCDWGPLALPVTKPPGLGKACSILTLPVYVCVCCLFQSSLLSAVLGELPPSQGLVSVHGRIAYVSQQPWVFSGTVRSNILFGKKYEKERYEKVIKACALKKDLQLLEDGDLTVIGDRGTTLSGGQKARVNLARAVYQDADIYLLDDPLSAVDAEVSRHLFELCICQALHGKITILVTHQLQYLKAASQILILKDSESHILSTLNPQWQHRAQDIFGSCDCNTKDIQVTLPEESRSEGKVGFKAYKNYFTAGAHWFIIIFLILLNIAAQASYILQDWWLSYWANQQGALNITVNGKGNETEKLDLNWYLGIYSGLTVATVLFGLARSLLVFYVLVSSSQTLHNKMFESILRAPVLFFDRNPIGKSDTKFLSKYVLTYT
ncbi:Multidrug resistance-associated protein 4 [Camelus dromedarius]|uniref:Multidrug resistance-associated protein 4 n=1 Tax=Camelus dromedarius TaxID=9838 RepID=A0A5N4D913_CAMDR|nr:Multidrug resistance-associated protein 4 [Camelus dromedarius]